MMLKKIILGSLLLAAVSANASNTIRYVQYDKNIIPNIVTASGIASEIIFDPKEKIEYATFGFSSAWEYQVVNDYILVFKSKDKEPETNLIIHTDKRDYLFTITSGNNQWTKHPNRSKAVFSTRMVYADQDKIEKLSLRNIDISKQGIYRFSDYDYRATTNANNLIPFATWDNGILTFIAFKPGTKRGAVYELETDGKTSLLNYHTEKNGLYVVHGVYDNLLIRLGDDAVELRANRPQRKENTRKSSVDFTKRVVANDAPERFADTPNQTTTPENTP